VRGMSSSETGLDALRSVVLRRVDDWRNVVSIHQLCGKGFYSTDTADVSRRAATYVDKVPTTGDLRRYELG
jgi:hypothetical protein